MIREKATVKFINGPYVGQTATIISSYDSLGVALVALENGDLVKAPFNTFSEILVKAETEEKPEGAKTIDIADYRVAVSRTIKDVAEKLNEHNGAFASILALIIGNRIEEDIFTDDKTTVVMTEDQFVGIVWDTCRPDRLREITPSNITSRERFKTSLGAVAAIAGLPDILFGESDNA